MLTTVSGFVDKYGVNAANGGQLIVGAVAISAVLGLAAYIALQLPEIASALAGGGAALSAQAAEYVASTYVAPCRTRLRRHGSRRTRHRGARQPGTRAGTPHRGRMTAAQPGRSSTNKKTRQGAKTE